jgi:hypothetical protein
MAREIQMNEECIMKLIATETAKMSYPGAMSMQAYDKQIVRGGTKKELSKYFQECPNINELWNKMKLKKYDEWHRKTTIAMSRKLKKEYYNKSKESDAISAKFLNTFMHQLMKYERFRYLYEKLHLPLDGQVFRQLSKKAIVIQKGIEIPITDELQEIAKNNKAYKINYKQYMQIQDLLLEELIPEFKKHLPKRCQLESRIDLNAFLWINKKRIIECE